MRIDGAPVFDNFFQDGLPQGDIGLIARNTHARFDDIDVRNFGRQDPYREDFNDGAANNWTPLSGTWSATSKVYTEHCSHRHNHHKSPLGRMWEVGERTDLACTFKVRMLNPYGASGNLVGIAWVRRRRQLHRSRVLADRASASEQVRMAFARRSQAHPIWGALAIPGSKSRSVTTTPAIRTTSPISRSMAYRCSTLRRMCGKAIFAHHTLGAGHFDNVRAAARFLSPFSENFETHSAAVRVDGTWSTQTACSTTLPSFRRVGRSCSESVGWHDLADIELRARMINRFGPPAISLALRMASAGRCTTRRCSARPAWRT